MSDAGEEKCRADVEKFGWHVVHVPPDDDTPGWSFTVGLHKTCNHPEILVFGIPIEIAHDVLNMLGARVKAGAVIADEARISDILEGFELVARRVHTRWYEPFLGMACAFYGNESFATLQLFWPDKKGRWPWDAGAPPALRAEQPLLWHDDVEQAGAGALLASMEG